MNIEWSEFALVTEVEFGGAYADERARALAHPGDQGVKFFKLVLEGSGDPEARMWVAARRRQDQQCMPRLLLLLVKLQAYLIVTCAIDLSRIYDHVAGGLRRWGRRVFRACDMQMGGDLFLSRGWPAVLVFCRGGDSFTGHFLYPPKVWVLYKNLP